MITFSFVEAAQPVRGKLVYSSEDCSFGFEKEATAAYDFLKRAGSGSAPLVIDYYLQLEVGVETGFLLYVHGLHNYHRWKQASLPGIRPMAGIVKAHFDREMKVAVGVKLVPPNTWMTIYDPLSGWVYIGPQAIPAADHHVEFADNTVAALAHDKLVALWLRPQMESPIELKSEGRQLSV
jgi:hypothetical protein